MFGKGIFPKSINKAQFIYKNMYARVYTTCIMFSDHGWIANSFGFGKWAVEVISLKTDVGDSIRHQIAFTSTSARTHSTLPTFLDNLLSSPISYFILHECCEWDDRRYLYTMHRFIKEWWDGRWTILQLLLSSLHWNSMYIYCKGLWYIITYLLCPSKQTIHKQSGVLDVFYIYLCTHFMHK